MVKTSEVADREGVLSAARLHGIVRSSWISQAVCVAAELRIADLLADGPKDVAQLARSTECEAPSLRRLMRALVSLDLCAELDDGAFALRPTGSLLRANAPDSLRSWTIWWGRHLWPVWGNLRHSVQTGERNRTESPHETAGDVFLGRDAGAAAVFNQAMVELTRLVSTEVIRAYDFSGMKRIVDVGGGHGELLAAILRAHTKMRGVLFDLPHAIEGARVQREAGLVDRLELVAGSFFDSVPGGGDAYLMKSVLHDWPDEQSAVILRNCRQVMPEHASLLIVERIMAARMRPSPEHQVMAWSDLNMLVVLGGRERTEAEFRGLLASSGFEVAGILPTALGFSVIEALPC